MRCCLIRWVYVCFCEFISLTPCVIILDVFFIESMFVSPITRTVGRLCTNSCDLACFVFATFDFGVRDIVVGIVELDFNIELSAFHDAMLFGCGCFFWELGACWFVFGHVGMHFLIMIWR